MAIYHFTVKMITRSKGQSAVASAAYRAAQKLFDERLGKHHNYQNKPNVIHSEISIPANAPAWLQQIAAEQLREQLWNSVEHSEKRVNSQLAREVEFALPIELNQKQAIQLAREFIQDQFVSLGMIADWNIHWEEHNPHVHVMFSTREILAHGFGKKVRAWNQKELLQSQREQWANYANFHLQKNQKDVHIDHRSYVEQGIDLIPTQHLGQHVLEMTRRGIETDLIKEANVIKQQNLNKITQKPQLLLQQLALEKHSFSWQMIVERLERFLPFEKKENDILSKEAIQKIVATLEQHHSVFTERDLARVLFSHINEADVFTQALIKLKTSKHLISLGIGDAGQERFTTSKMLQVENQIQQLAAKLNKTHHQNISKCQIEQGLKAYENETGKTLTDEQKQAVLHLVKRSSIACLVGRAGTGKSFTLGAAKIIWEKAGLNVQGIALSGVASDNLSQSSGIPSRTIESFRYALQEGIIQLSSNDVVVMDEAGMTDNESMLFVLKAIQKSGAKLCLIGDHAQLQPIGAGAIFRILIERLGFVELQTVYRQKEAWQRDATIALSKGHIRKGLEAYQQQGCVHFEKDEQETIKRLIQDWQLMRQTKSLSSLIITAHRNQDVKMLNQAARENLIASNFIKNIVTIATPQGTFEFGEQERILCLKNNRALGVKNGSFATIVSMEKDKLGKVLTLTIQLDSSNKLITFSPSDYPDFTYGYAATVYKLQGCTLGHTFNYLGGKGWNKNLLYVAGTRHRETCYFYAEQTLYTTFERLCKRLSRQGFKESVFDYSFSKEVKENARLAVQYYLNSNTSKLKQSYLALMMSYDRKTYHSTLMDARAEWKQVFRDAQHAKQKLFYADCSPDEKTLLRLARRYQRVNRQVGRVWSAILQKKYSSNTKKLEVANILLAKRNYFASKIVTQCGAMKMQSMLEGKTISNPWLLLKSKPRLNFEKIKQQAATHRSNVKMMREWHEMFQNSFEQLKSILKAEEKSNLLHQYENWKLMYEDNGTQTEKLLKNIERYHYALQEIGQSSQHLQQQIVDVKNIETSIHQFTTKKNLKLDNNIQERIERACLIESQTLPIQNTIAECYLCEHRGIKGEIPKSLRFHPNFYNAELKQKLPALVAIAKDEIGQTTAVQVTFLDEKTANKASVETKKLTYGLLSTEQMGVLINQGKNNHIVAVAEGIETALSIKEANPDLTVYAVLGSSNFERVPIQSETKHVLFCTDNDGANSASQKQLQKAAEKLATKNISVWQTMPKDIKQDFNDVLKIEGKTAIKNYLQKAKLIKPAMFKELKSKKLFEINISEKKNDPQQIEQQAILNQLQQLEKNIEAAEKQPYAYLRTAAQEAFEKYVTQLVKNNHLITISSMVSQDVKQRIDKVFEQAKSIEH